MYLKKHRDSEFWKQESQGVFEVKAYKRNKLVLDISTLSNNLVWKQYLPAETLVVDKLIIPPGMDLDNLFVGVGGSYEELPSPLQKLLGGSSNKPQTVMLEKEFHLKHASYGA